MRAEVSFISIDCKRFTVEGVVFLSDAIDFSKTEIFLCVNGNMLTCRSYRIRLRDRIRNGKLVEKALGFAGTVENYIKYKFIEVAVYLTYKDTNIKATLTPGKFFPITAAIKNAYFYRNGYIFILVENSICIYKSGVAKHLKREILFLKELKNINTKQSKKAIAARCFYHVAKCFKRKKIWLISDRINKADDNGEAFFKYLNEKRVPENVYFVIRKDSKDYNVVKNYGKVLSYNSRNHKLLHLLADVTVSAAGNKFVKNPFGEYSVYYQDILSQQKHVLLRHGVGQNNQTDWLNRFNSNLSMIVTCAESEYKSFLSQEYYFDEKSIKLTGLARHDRLYEDRKNVITIMPTWRNNLIDKSKIEDYDKDGQYRYSRKKFVDTEYFCFYNSLINNKTLLQKAEEYGYTIQFMPHPNIIIYINWFEKNEKVRFCSIETKYRTVFAESALVVTDYSSVAFDFAYLRKPVLYCQFDRDNFYATQFGQGYFDYEQDGFGEVTYNLNDTVDRILEYMENGCVLKEKYRSRINTFFAFHDKNNCQRIYEAIKSIE